MILHASDLCHAFEQLGGLVPVWRDAPGERDDSVGDRATHVVPDRVVLISLNRRADRLGDLVVVLDLGNAELAHDRLDAINLKCPVDGLCLDPERRGASIQRHLGSLHPDLDPIEVQVVDQALDLTRNHVGVLSRHRRSGGHGRRQDDDGKGGESNSGRDGHRAHETRCSVTGSRPPVV